MKRTILYAGLLAVMAGMALATWHFLSPRSSPINFLLTGTRLPAVPRAQRPPTQDPNAFTGEAVEAYRIARERPALLERLPCYCGCYEQQGHQNLLDCFADKHASRCDVCLRIARRAGELDQRGYGVEDIRALIDREFAPGKYRE